MYYVDITLLNKKKKKKNKKNKTKTIKKKTNKYTVIEILPYILHYLSVASDVVIVNPVRSNQRTHRWCKG